MFLRMVCLVSGMLLLILTAQFLIGRQQPSSAAWIVFSSDRHGNHDIFRMLPNGTQVHQLTDNPAEDTEPMWSSNGEWIVFVSWRASIQLFRIRPDGTDVEQLSETLYYPSKPEWSVDGRWVYFVDAPNPIDWVEVFRINTSDGSVERPPDFPEDIIDFSWSPDGEWLAYIWLGDGNEELYRIRANGADNQRLTDHSSRDYAPSWSPDGKWIAFASNQDGNSEIYRIRPDGTDFERLTRDIHSDRKPTWSPDGKWITFISERDGNPEIYRIRPDGTDLQRITHNQSIEDNPSWSPLVDLAWSPVQVGLVAIALLASGGVMGFRAILRFPTSYFNSSKKTTLVSIEAAFRVPF